MQTIPGATNIQKKIPSDNWQHANLPHRLLYTLCFSFFFGPYLQVFYLSHFLLVDGAPLKNEIKNKSCLVCNTPSITISVH